MTARLVEIGLPLCEAGVSEGDGMSQQSARRSALDAQVILRRERADRQRRLEGLAITVLTALGERDAAVRDAERRAGRCERRSSGAAVAPIRCGR